MNRKTSLAVRIAVLCALIPVRAAASAPQGLTVNPSNGQVTYRYGFKLPAARGRYQPSLGVVFQSPGASATACAVAHKGYGRNWSLDLPTISVTDSGFFYNDVFLVPGMGGVTLNSTTRGGLVAKVESRFMQINAISAGVLEAIDADGNKSTFQTDTPEDPVALYVLKQVIDRDGNITKYSYADSNYGLLLTTIQYNGYQPGAATSTAPVGATTSFATTISLEYLGGTGAARPSLANIRIQVRSGTPGLASAATVRRYQVTMSGAGTTAPELESITSIGGESGPEQLVTTFGRSATAPSVGCLTTVTSPLGGRQEVAYVSSSTFPSVTTSYPVAKTLTTSGPGMATGTESYWYSAGGGTRGFAESWSQNAATGIVSHTRWETTSLPFVGAPASLEFGEPRQGSAGTATTPPVIDVFRTIAFGHSAKRINDGGCIAASVEPAAGDYPLIPVTVSQTDTRDVDGISLVSSVVRPCDKVDRWGNAQQETVDPDASRTGDEYTVNRVFPVTTDSTFVCKDCISSATVSSATALLSEVQYGYSATGQLSFVKRRATPTETSLQLVSSWTYHGNGNLAFRVEGGATYTYTYDDYYQLRPRMVVAADVLDLPVPRTQLVSETDYDAFGQPVSLTGPYYQTTVAGIPESLRPKRFFAYDSLGRIKAVARQPFVGSSVSQALSAFTYQPRAGAVPASVTSIQFAQPATYSDPYLPQTSDAHQVTTFLDGFARPIQVRERLGGTGPGDPAANISRVLSQYRVTGAGLRDGAGRVIAAVGPYFSAGAGYVDLSVSAVDRSSGTVRATYTSYDTQGRPTCSTVKVVTSTLAAGAPQPGVCQSSFTEDASYASASATLYRGLTDPLDGGRRVLGVKTVEPRFTASGLSTGPEVFVDAAGRVRRSVDAEGNGSRYEYDQLGRVTGLVREVAGGVTPEIRSSVVLDLMGRVSIRVDPNIGRRRFSYDPTTPGLLASVYFERPDATLPGQYKVIDEIRYDYDKGRVKSVQFCKPGGSCVTDASYSWDLPYVAGNITDPPPGEFPNVYRYTAGNMALASNDNTTIAAGYDDGGNVVRRDQWLPGIDGYFKLLTTPRADGRPTNSSFTEPGRTEVSTSTSYDSAGQPVSVTAGGNVLWAAQDGGVATGAYNAIGQLGAVNLDDGRLQQTWTYGASSGLLTGQSATIPGAANPVVYQVGEFTYRGTMLQGYTDNLSQTTYQYWYSDTNRLVAAKATPSNIGPLSQNNLSCFGFSTSNKFGAGPSFGNIEVVKEGTAQLASKDYGYSGTNIEPGPAGPDGPTSVGPTALTYDEYGRIQSTGGGVEAFAYDLAGRMTVINRAAGLSEVLRYDPFGMLLFRQVGATTYRYVGQVATVATTSAGMTVDVHVSAPGGRFASIRVVGATPRTLFLVRDRLTSVVATTLAGGVAGASYRYSPHGVAEVAVDDVGDKASELGYAGALRLSGGLLWMGARVYNPALKIFMQPDPLAPHSFTYAGGDPVNRWDPTGLADKKLPATPANVGVCAMNSSSNCTTVAGPMASLIEGTAIIDWSKVPTELHKVYLEFITTKIDPGEMPPPRDDGGGDPPPDPVRVPSAPASVRLGASASIQPSLPHGRASDMPSRPARASSRGHAFESGMASAYSAVGLLWVSGRGLRTGAQVLGGVAVEQAASMLTGSSIDGAMVGGAVALAGALIGNSMKLGGPAGVLAGAAVAFVTGVAGSVISDLMNPGVNGVQVGRAMAAGGLNALAATIPGFIPGNGLLMAGLRQGNAFGAAVAANLAMNGAFPSSPRRRRRDLRRHASRRRFALRECRVGARARAP